VSRAVRLPFSFGQRVEHQAFAFPFIVVAQECDKLGDWTISVTGEKGAGWWKFPAHELSYVSLADEQEAIADWMGCSVEQMNRHHDRMHLWLSERLGVRSLSLAISHGERLSPAEGNVAAAEEDAVLAVGKYLIAVERMLERTGP
jgi:hypothetical protein